MSPRVTRFAESLFTQPFSISEGLSGSLRVFSIVFAKSISG